MVFNENFFEKKLFFDFNNPYEIYDKDNNSLSLESFNLET